MQLKSFLLPALLSAIPCLALNEIPVANSLMQIVSDKYNAKSPFNLYQRARILKNYEDQAWVSKNILKIVDKEGFAKDVPILADNAEGAWNATVMMDLDLAELKKVIELADSVENLTQEEKAALANLHAEFDKAVSTVEVNKRVIDTLTNWFMSQGTWETLPWTAEDYLRARTELELANPAWNEWALHSGRQIIKYRLGGKAVLDHWRRNKASYTETVLPVERKKVAIALASDHDYLVRDSTSYILSTFEDIMWDVADKFVADVLHIRGRRLDEHREAIVSAITNRWRIRKLNAHYNFPEQENKFNTYIRRYGNKLGFGLNEILKKKLPNSRVNAVMAAAKEKSVKQVGTQRMRVPQLVKDY